MLSVSRAKNFGERKRFREEPQRQARSFIVDITSEPNGCEPCKSPGEKQVKNNLKKIKKVLKNS